ncbi:class I lanthipeptide [Taibaiella koreensis]|uniref:class I lanthipeptide n=1 Tax=Taibaiella koreensis TaxID=1268548 RepID=UPI0013C31EB1|nr:class I lanthipeptide [Taibaiella koreensis]
MKKQKIQISRKLVLAKETISNLGADDQHKVVGGMISTPQVCHTFENSCFGTCESVCDACPTSTPPCTGTITTPVIC